jgi:hypothetical protein
MRSREHVVRVFLKCVWLRMVVQATCMQRWYMQTYHLQS